MIFLNILFAIHNHFSYALQGHICIRGFIISICLFLLKIGQRTVTSVLFKVLFMAGDYLFSIFWQQTHTTSRECLIFWVDPVFGILKLCQVLPRLKSSLWQLFALKSYSSYRETPCFLFFIPKGKYCQLRLCKINIPFWTL